MKKVVSHYQVMRCGQRSLQMLSHVHRVALIHHFTQHFTVSENNQIVQIASIHDEARYPSFFESE